MPRVNLKMAIFRSGRTQRRFAHEAHIRENRLSAIVQGWVDPRPEERAAIAALLGHRPDDGALFRNVTTGEADGREGQRGTQYPLKAKRPRTAEARRASIPALKESAPMQSSVPHPSDVTRAGAMSHGNVTITVPALTPADLAQHMRLGISPELLTEAGVRRVTDGEARELLSSRHRGSLEGLIYPYCDPITRYTLTYRLRRDHPEIESGQPRDKYLSAYGDNRHLYFPPRADALLSDRSVTVVSVEAEKSALSLASAAERHPHGRDRCSIGSS